MKERLSKDREKAVENILEEETPVFPFLGGGTDKDMQSGGLWHLLHWRTGKMCCSIKYMAQHIFRASHLSDMELWNMDLTLTKWIYPRLKDFIKRKRTGYPAVFAEYNEQEWNSREQYDEAVKSGKLLGGGAEAWEKTLQEMIFAFEWILYYKNYSNKKQRDDFCKKWNIKNPHEKRLENKLVDYEYEDLKPGMAWCVSKDPELDKKEPEKYRFLGRCVRYYNAEYEFNVIERRARKGFELFGKFFTDLWD